MNVEELSKTRAINFQECSAMSQEGIWEGITTLIDIFERMDPSKSSAFDPSTGATDTMSNKEISGRDSVANNAAVKPKSSSSPRTEEEVQSAIEIALQKQLNPGNSKPLVEENKNFEVQQPREVIIKKDDQTRRISMR